MVAYFDAVFPSNKHFESSMITSADASFATGVVATEVCALGNGVAGASGLTFAFDDRDFSLGPWPVALTLIFLHLSCVGKTLDTISTAYIC